MELLGIALQVFDDSLQVADKRIEKSADLTCFIIGRDLKSLGEIRISGADILESCGDTLHWFADEIGDYQRPDSGHYDDYYNNGDENYADVADFPFSFQRDVC